MIIRVAEQRDVAGIAKVHVDTWRTTYGGIVPQEFLDALSYEGRERMWSATVSAPQPSEHLLVAENESGEVIGFACGGKSRTVGGKYAGEIFAIYLLQEFQGKGFGKKLFTAAVNQMLADGIESAMLWALEDNASCRFYAAMGGAVFDQKWDDIGGKNLKELAFGWDHLTAPDHVLHITSRQLWETSLTVGKYEHPSLLSDKFVHCSRRDQVLTIANEIFLGQRDLVLLQIDTSKLQCELKYENLEGGCELYPHIYGAIERNTVVAVHKFDAQLGGRFHLFDLPFLRS